MPTTSTVLAPAAPTARREVRLPQQLFDRILTRTAVAHAAGLKSFGLLLADPLDHGFPFTASDVVFFDPTRNRRNDPSLRPAFEAQGTYFRAYDDAGFVADPAELLAVHRRLEASGLEAVAPFHVHRRQPANFSVIDFRLHNPAYAWHLVISLRDAAHPRVQAFAVDKDVSAEFGIGPEDSNEDSEQTYAGPEVSSLDLAVGRREPSPV
jgi:proteasome lid subunit RPN8/RPN11